MTAICKHDFLRFFRSPIGFVYVGVFAAIANLVFFASCVLSSSSDLTSPFSFLLTVLLFLTPMLTMRLLSEEYRQGTDRLLLTAPVSVWEIVLGKFFAALGMLLCCLLVTIPWLIILLLAGTPAWATILGCYVAIVCAAMVFLSIGLFLSSVTESQVIAAVLSFALFLALYLLDVLRASATGLLARVLDWFSVFSRYDTFMAAQFSFHNLIYFLSLTALFLFFTARVLERRRKAARSGAFLLSASVALAIAAVILLNLIATNLGDRFDLNLDLTESKLYTISPESYDVMDGLSEDVTITVLLRADDLESNAYGGYIQKLLTKYAAYTDKITINYIDPYQNPSAVEEFASLSGSVSAGSIIVQSGDQSRVLNLIDFYGTDADSSSGYTYVSAFRGESTLTSALLAVTSEDTPHAYVLRGHNESVSDSFSTMLESSGYAVDTLTLAESDIPDSASLLILSLPQKDYTEDELNQLDAYVKDGGDLLVFDGTESPTDLDNLYAYLREWGITVEPEMVLDAEYNINDARYVLAELSDSTVNDALAAIADQVLVTPDAKPLTVKLPDAMNDRTAESLLSTRETAYARVIDKSTRYDSYKKQKSDTAGPFDLAALAEYTGNDANGQILVCSSALMMTDQLMQSSSLLNSDFLRSTISSMQPEIELISIDAKSMRAEPLTLSTTATYVIFLLLLFLPLFLFGCGILVFFHRRNL